jgi:hypothetical protein
MIWFRSIEASSHGLIRFSCRRRLTVLATTALRRYQSEFAYKKVKLYGRICAAEVGWGWVKVNQNSGVCLIRVMFFKKKRTDKEMWSHLPLIKKFRRDKNIKICFITN